MVFNSFLDGIFGPFLLLEPFWAILIISFLISLFITIIYKLLTDQKMMKELKQEMKDLQKQMRELAKHPEKLMKVQKKAMEKNFSYMKHSMKPTLITFLPIILIFGWLGSHMAYYPLTHETPFTVTAEFADGVTGSAKLILPPGLTAVDATKTISGGLAVWTLSGKSSTVPYTFDVEYEGQQFQKNIIITEGRHDRRYVSPEETFKDKPVKTITVSNEEIVAMNLFGWELGWLGTYIILSIVFSLGLRKLFRIY